MNTHFTRLHNMSSRKWFSLGAVAAVLIAAAGPGEVITIWAVCGYPPGNNASPPDSSAQCSMVVISPIYRAAPVYLAHGWQRTTTRKDGSKFTYTDTIAAGVLVRSFVWLDGQVRLVDGVLSRDGKIVSDGRLLDRAESPDYVGLYAQPGGG